MISALFNIHFLSSSTFRTEIRNILRKLQYDIKIHLVDEVPVEFTDMHVRPDTKYGVPPVINNKNHPLHPPSPTYGVPGHEPGSPSTRVVGSSFPNEFERTPAFASTPPPSPTYGVPKNTYIPPPSINSFQVNPSTQDAIYFRGNRIPTSSSEGGYVYNRPAANLKSAPLSSQSQVKRADSEDSKSDGDEDEEKDSGSVRSIEFTTDAPRPPPEFFFSEQFEMTQRPPTAPTSSVPVLQQTHAFHPQEQPFFPNSPPAPFSTAAYQEQRSLNLQTPAEQTEPLPTLATDTQPPSPQAKNYYRTDSQASATSTKYNQAEWFRRISRSLTNGSDVQVERNATFLNELRVKKEMLQSLFPAEDDENADEEIDEDLIINFGAARTGNRTSRIKRQSFYSNRLCETTTQFIEPQTALSRDGEWKFIVNQVESARQLVQVEYCA